MKICNKDNISIISRAVFLFEKCSKSLENVVFATKRIVPIVSQITIVGQLLGDCLAIVWQLVSMILLAASAMYFLLIILLGFKISKRLNLKQTVFNFSF